MHDVPSLVQLLKVLQQVPYLASKNIYRVASHFLHMDQQQMEHFCQVLLHAKKNVIPCQICYAWRERTGQCSLCNNPQRDQSIICVVESWQELLAIEKTGGYSGTFHVLGGLICPLNGIGPENLTIAALLLRAQTPVKEIILALSQTPEGEATAAYIARKLQEHDILVSCLARGIPVGSSLEYMDRLTVYKALSDRRPF